MPNSNTTPHINSVAAINGYKRRMEDVSMVEPTVDSSKTKSEITTALWDVINTLELAAGLMMDCKCQECRDKGAEAIGAAGIAEGWIEGIREET